MKKARYRFNTETLTYEKIHRSVLNRVLRLSGYLFTVSLFSAIGFTIGPRRIDSPKENYLENEIAQVKLKYGRLDKHITGADHVLKGFESRENTLYRPVLNAGVIPPGVWQAGFGGADRYKDLQGYDNSPIMTKSAKRMDKLVHEILIESKSYDQLEELAKRQKRMQECMPAIRPLSPGEYVITSGFGWRINPIYKTGEFHDGIDFAAAKGTPIHATGDGVVERADNTLEGYGNSVTIDHGFGYETLYAHMSIIAVTAGQKIKRGQVIGYVGSTGLSTGDHVHYSVIKNGQEVNPINYFDEGVDRAEYKAIARAAMNEKQPAE